MFITHVSARRASRPHSRTPLRRIALAATCVALLAACSSAPTDDKKPVDGDDLSPGTLVTQSQAGSATVLSSAKSTQLITYVSTSAAGEPILVSGTVSVPKTAAPEGGYPVISWAHGTTGYADICAPSNDTADGPVHDYLAGIDTVLDSWVAEGYAVVQTDYEGLGTPGGHAYMNGTSASNTVVDIVRAARQLDGDIGKNWAVMGHSQGGAAVLSTAALGPKRAPELSLKAAVSIAPGPGGQIMVNVVKNIETAKNPAEAAAAAPFLPVLVLGAQAADPKIDPEGILSDAALPMLTTARTGCLAQIRTMKVPPPGQVFRQGADLTPFYDYLATQDTPKADLQVPTMIAQGTEDKTVVPRITDLLVKQLCAEVSVPLDYKVYPGQDHRGSVAASTDDARTFLSAAFAGKKPAGNCS